jgi:hypothetical protein
MFSVDQFNRDEILNKCMLSSKERIKSARKLNRPMSSFVKRRPLSPGYGSKFLARKTRNLMNEQLLKETTNSYKDLIGQMNSKMRNIPSSSGYCKSPNPTTTLRHGLTNHLSSSIESLVNRPHLKSRYGSKPQKPRTFFTKIKNKAKIAPKRT